MQFCDIGYRYKKMWKLKIERGETICWLKFWEKKFSISLRVRFETFNFCHYSLLWIPEIAQIYTFLDEQKIILNIFSCLTSDIYDHSTGSRAQNTEFSQISQSQIFLSCQFNRLNNSLILSFKIQIPLSLIKIFWSIFLLYLPPDTNSTEWLQHCNRMRGKKKNWKTLSITYNWQSRENMLNVGEWRKSYVNSRFSIFSLTAHSIGWFILPSTFDVINQEFLSYEIFSSNKEGNIFHSF